MVEKKKAKAQPKKEFLTKQEVVEEIKDVVGKRWIEMGKKLDSDFYEDLDDVVSDFLEDSPNFFSDLNNNSKRKAIIDAVIDEMS